MFCHPPSMTAVFSNSLKHLINRHKIKTKTHILKFQEIKSAFYSYKSF